MTILHPFTPEPYHGKHRKGDPLPAAPSLRLGEVSHTFESLMAAALELPVPPTAFMLGAMQRAARIVERGGVVIPYGHGGASI